jgi:shikimate dehydrogenase
MSGGPAADDLPVAPEVVDAAETVLDVVAAPALTPADAAQDLDDERVVKPAESGPPPAR